MVIISMNGCFLPNTGRGIAFGNGASGASHGGRGGRGGHSSQRTLASNLPYGSIFEAGSWGSGGGSGGGAGGRGGGILHLNVSGSFVVDGNIYLDGRNAQVGFIDKNDIVQ